MFAVGILALDGFVVLREHLTDQLAVKYDSFELHSPSASTETVTSVLNFSTKEQPSSQV